MLIWILIERKTRVGSMCTRHTLSLSSPLPSRETVLKSIHNKVQLIDILTEYLLANAASKHRLFVTASADIPEEVILGICQKRSD